MECMEESIIEILRCLTPTCPPFNSPGYLEMLVAPLEELRFSVASPKRTLLEMALDPRALNIQSLDNPQPDPANGTENTLVPAKKRYSTRGVKEPGTNSAAGGDAFSVPLRETMTLAKSVNCDVYSVRRGDGKYIFYILLHDLSLTFISVCSTTHLMLASFVKSASWSVSKRRVRSFLPRQMQVFRSVRRRSLAFP